MRIVDRAEFLSMPAGTVYAKWEPCVFGPLCIKGDMRSDNDWYYIEASDAPAIDYGESIIDVLDRLDSGHVVGVDYNYWFSDSMYDPGQRFCIWSEVDVRALIDSLTTALGLAYPSPQPVVVT